MEFRAYFVRAEYALRGNGEPQVPQYPGEKEAPDLTWPDLTLTFLARGVGADGGFFCILIERNSD